MLRLLKFNLLIFSFLFAFSFLNNGVTLEEISLGSLSHNPSKYADYKDFLIETNYSFYSLSTSKVSFLLLRGTNLANYGLEVVNFKYGEIERRGKFPSNFWGYYSPEDYVISFLISKRASKNFNIGFSLKFYYSTLYIYSNYSFGFDFGFEYSPIKYLTGSLSFTNLSLPLHYISQNFYPPNNLNLTLKISSIEILDNYLEFTQNLREKDNCFKLGLNLKPHSVIDLKAGYNFDNKGFNLGFSIKPWKRNILKISYAYQIFNFLPSSHHLGISFGKIK
ncbi:MAG: hypothetical protein N2323_03625 [candidate division WOR-3 bacterium]|nr:hypothetical protein [candidate division WOR-3 bacterium]MCX7837031.1 hypothetical protein [candidate division WOR-3 bacterium]MDW8114400.1 hypothetical protein [candidate division WOR-3 bacterium]